MLLTDLPPAKGLVLNGRTSTTNHAVVLYIEADSCTMVLAEFGDKGPAGLIEISGLDLSKISTADVLTNYFGGQFDIDRIVLFE